MKQKIHCYFISNYINGMMAKRTHFQKGFKVKSVQFPNMFGQQQQRKGTTMDQNNSQAYVYNVIGLSSI